MTAPDASVGHTQSVEAANNNDGSLSTDGENQKFVGGEGTKTHEETTKSMLVVAVEGFEDSPIGPGLLKDGKALTADLEKSDKGRWGMFNKTKYLSDGDRLDFKAVGDLNKLPDLAKLYERVFIIAHGRIAPGKPQESGMMYNGGFKLDTNRGWFRTLENDLGIKNVENIFGCNNADGKLWVGVYDSIPEASITKQIQPLIEGYLGD